MTTTVLIDGDVFVYRYALGCEEHVDWGDGLWCSYANENVAKINLLSHIDALKERFQAPNLIVALGGEKNFRKDLEPTYKVNRRKRSPLLLYKVLFQHLRENYITLQHEGLEADDVLGLLATNPDDPHHKIIITVDKDLDQIPGCHYRLDKEAEGLFYIDEAQADWNFYKQVLTGDLTDGYKGCPGIGHHRATRILSDCIQNNERAWMRVVSAYQEAGLSVLDALHQARLARILRHGEYSPDTGVKLWEPPIQ